jgi:hypothetical protein
LEVVFVFTTLSAAKIAGLVKAKEISPVEIMEDTLRRIEARNPSINAIIFVSAEHGLKQARQLERRTMKGERQLGTVNDRNKLYALYAPEVECLAKGKARTPYEFGVKVSIMTTHLQGLVGAPARCRAIRTTIIPWKKRSSMRRSSATSNRIAIVDRGYWCGFWR